MVAYSPQPQLGQVRFCAVFVLFYAVFRLFSCCFHANNDAKHHAKYHAKSHVDSWPSGAFLDGGPAGCVVAPVRRTQHSVECSGTRNANGTVAGGDFVAVLPSQILQLRSGKLLFLFEAALRSDLDPLPQPSLSTSNVMCVAHNKRVHIDRLHLRGAELFPQNSSEFFQLDFPWKF